MIATIALLTLTASAQSIPADTTTLPETIAHFALAADLDASLMALGSGSRALRSPYLLAATAPAGWRTVTVPLHALGEVAPCLTVTTYAAPVTGDRVALADLDLRFPFGKIALDLAPGLYTNLGPGELDLKPVFRGGLEIPLHGVPVQLWIWATPGGAGGQVRVPFWWEQKG